MGDGSNAVEALALSDRVVVIAENLMEIAERLRRDDADVTDLTGAVKMIGDMLVAEAENATRMHYVSELLRQAPRDV